MCAAIASGASDNHFVVRGDHQYASAGAYIVDVTVNDNVHNLASTAESNLTRLPGNQTDGTIAIDPLDSSRLIAVSAEEGTGLFEATSSDGGVTWMGQSIAAGGADGLPVAGGQPQVAYDKFGNVYLAYVDEASNYVVVALSSDGGQSFSTLDTFFGAGGVSRPLLATGPGPNGAASLWLAYLQGSQIDATGTDADSLGVVGVLSQPQVAAGAGPSETIGLGGLAVGPTGQVLLTYQTQTASSGPATIYAVADMSGLSGSFASPSPVAQTNVGGSLAIPPQATHTVSAGARLAWDLSGGANNGRVYLVYTDSATVGSPATRIFLRSSSDNGKTWSNRVQVSDDTGNSSEFMPSIAVDQADGDVAVAWYDARGDANDVTTQFFAAASINGGQSFSPNVTVGLGNSDATNGSLNSYGQQNQYGDYTGLAFNAGILYPAWADNTTELGGNPDLPQFDLAIARPAVAHIADLPLTAKALDISADVKDEGGSFTANLATFMDPDPNAQANLYTATIDWGDPDPNTGAADTTSGTIISNGGGTFTVRGTHFYMAAGIYTITITINDEGGASAKVTTPATISDAPLKPGGGVALTAYVGQPIQAIVGTFTDSDPNGAPDDYSTTIDWGDQQQSNGIVTFAGSASLTYDVYNSSFYTFGNNDLLDDNLPYLMSISPQGLVTPEVPVDDTYYGGLAFDPNSQDEALYAISNAPSGVSTLMRLDLTTETFSPVSVLGAGFTGGLTFNATDGNLYAISGSGSTWQLDEISPGNGSVSVLGSLAPPGRQAAFDYTGLSFSGDGKLYAVGNDSDGNSTLYEVDLTTPLSVTPLFSLGNDLVTPPSTQEGFTGGLAYAPLGVPTQFAGDLVGISEDGSGTTYFNTIDLSGTVSTAFEVSVAGSPGQTKAGSGDFTNGFNVIGTHTYGQPIVASLTVGITDIEPSPIPDSVPRSTATDVGTIYVGYPPPQALPATQAFTEFQGVPTGTLALAAFTIPASAATASGMSSATIEWGDGSSDSGTIVLFDGGDTLQVSGSHTYVQSGIFHPTITLTDNQGATGTATATVNVAPDVTSRVKVIDLGGPFNLNGEFHQQIEVQLNTNGTTIPLPLYVEIENLPAGVTVTKANGTIDGHPEIEIDSSPNKLNAMANLEISDPSLIPISFTANVFDGPGGTTVDNSVQLTALPVTAVAGQVFDGSVASTPISLLTLPNIANDTFNIDWGDGTSSAGTVLTSGFYIEGRHTYAHAGRFPLSVSVDGPDGPLFASATAAGFVNVDGPIVYHVTVDTSSLSGTAGFADLQFNPGGLPDAQPADISISNFVVTGGTLGSVTVAGGGSGSLAGTADLQNSAMLNEVRQAITFGTRISFDAQVSGDVLTNASDGLFGSSFSLLLLGSDGMTPLETIDPGGSALRIVVTPDGSTASENYPAQASSAPAAAAVVQDIAVVNDAPPVVAGLPQTLTEFASISTGELTLASFSVALNVDLPQDTYTATIDWGDGSSDTVGNVALTGATLSVSGSHLYATAGDFQATVTVSDQLGDSGTQTFSAQVLGDVTDRVRIESSGLIFNPATGLYVGHITYTNTSSSALSGPLPIVLENLPAGVALANGAGTTGPGGEPYLKDTAATVAPGESRDVLVQFSDPSGTPINYAPGVFDPPPPPYQFGPAITTPTAFAEPGIQEPRHLLTGDFNNDGKLDLVVYTSYGVELFLGAGDGTLTPAPDEPLINNVDILSTGFDYFTEGIVDVEAGDFNGDGNLDLLVVLPGAVEVYLGDGTGRFSLAAGAVTEPTASFSNGGVLGVYVGFGADEANAAVADFNHDGHLDVAVEYNSYVGSEQIDNIWVLLGDGKGGFVQTPIVLPTTNDVYDQPLSLLAADVNGDGNADVEVGETNQLQVFLGDGSGDFVEAKGSPDISTTYGVGSIQAAINPAGTGQDLLVVPGNGVFILSNDGSGTFGQPSPLEDFSDPVGAGPNAAVADFNGDGKPDIAELVGNGGGDPFLNNVHGSDAPWGVFLALNNGDGTFQVPHGTGTIPSGDFLPLPDVTDVTDTTEGIYLDIAAGDFNGDGRPDMVVLQMAPGIPTGPPENGDYNPLNIVVLPSLGGGTAAPLTAAGANMTAVEGTPFNGTVATFTDANPKGQLSDYTATITWGDGSSSTGSISADPNVAGQFDVSGTHTYAEAGYYPVVVSIASQDGAAATAVDYVAATAVDGSIEYAVSVDTSALAGQSGQLALQFNPGGLPGAQDATATVSRFTLTAGSLTGTPTLVGGTSGSLSATAVLENSGVLNELTQGVTFGTGLTFDLTLSGPAVSESGGDLFGSAFGLELISSDGQATLLTADPSGATLIANLNGDGTSEAYGLLANNATQPIAQPQDVFDAPLTATATTVNGTVGVAFTGLVANFSDANSLGTVSEFSATIDWGDGTSSSGTVSGANGSFAVSGAHTYAKAGNDSVTVVVGDVDGQTATAASQADIIGGSLQASGTTITATAASAVTVGVASFSEVNEPPQTVFMATIDWGDGTQSPGAVSANGNDGFAVTATHAYAHEGTRSISVTIVGSDGTTATAISQADVADAPLVAAGDSITATAKVAFTGQVATFSDADPSGTAADFTATIDWGDGTSSAGTVAAGPSGPFEVTGMHTYASAGNDTIVVAIHDVGGALASTTSSATVIHAASTSSIQIEPTGIAVVGYANTPLDGIQVAAFTLSDGSTSGSFSASIDWGDGVTDSGSIVLSGVQYVVSGSHTYLDPGDYTLQIDIEPTAVPGMTGLSAAVATTATISEPSQTGGDAPNYAWIDKVYRDLFNRPAEPQGRAYWVGFLDQGQSREEVAYAIVKLAYPREFQHDTVDQLYEQYLGRAPDPAGMDYWVAFLYDGGSIEQMSLALCSSPEFHQLHGDSETDLLDALYQDVLGRAPDSAGEAYWEEQMANGMSELAVTAAIFGSDEYLRIRVNALYEQFLDRPADPTGAEYFASQLANGTRDEVIIAQLLASDEYYQKAQL
ncbi:MAG TPA: NF038129 family PEP-CTERM protein [Pirellulales bacterium]|nr:NF038129 family PEP-CTERM protein [Pirellulales bacterium]